MSHLSYPMASRTPVQHLQRRLRLNWMHADERLPDIQPPEWGVVANGILPFQVLKHNWKTFRGSRRSYAGLSGEGGSIYSACQQEVVSGNDRTSYGKRIIIFLRLMTRWRPRIAEKTCNLLQSGDFLVCTMRKSRTGVECLMSLWLTGNRLPAKGPQICSGKLVMPCTYPFFWLNIHWKAVYPCRLRPIEEPAIQGDCLICWLYASLTDVGDFIHSGLSKNRCQRYAGAEWNPRNPALSCIGLFLRV